MLKLQKTEYENNQKSSVVAIPIYVDNRTCVLFIDTNKFSDSQIYRYLCYTNHTVIVKRVKNKLKKYVNIETVSSVLMGNFSLDITNNFKFMAYKVIDFTEEGV